MNIENDGHGGADEADIARAMRLVGRRPALTEQQRAAAFERVHAEWRAATATAVSNDGTAAARPTHGRWRAALAASLAAGVVAVAVLSGRVATQPGPEVALASVARGVEVKSAASRPWQFWSVAPRGLQAGTSVRQGDTLQTGAEGVALLRVGPLLALRVAPRSELRFDAQDRVTLLHGQIYIDSGTHAGPGTPLTVVTQHGEVRHLGTRYLVRATADRLDVAVRDGRVLLASLVGDLRAEASAGERLQLAAGANAIERGALAPDDAAYGWLARIPTPLDIEGKTLGEFVAWYEAETGRSVDLGSHDSVAAVRSIRLSGSVAGMTPDEALDMVAAVSDLTVDRANGRVRIDTAR
jgi:ferric-dicitrate binding protein FerR (iron transport regulator)